MSTNTYSTLAGLPAASSNTGNIALVTSNGVQYISDGEKWKSQGEFTTGTIESLQLDDLSFNGVLTNFPLKVNNNNVFPHLTTNVIIVVNGNTLKPGRDFNFIKSSTSTNISFTNSDNTPKAYPSGTIFYGLVFSRLPIDNNNALQTSGGTMIGDITFSSNQTFPSSGIANATTSQAGIVSLSSSTGSTSESVAATSKAVKDTKDAADAAASTANASLPKSGGTMTGNITFNSTQQFDGRDVSADGAKLDGIEASATADQTAAEIRTLVESASDSNVFTDADHSKLNGIESGATGDQTNAEIRAAVEAASDSNVFTDADHTKLNGIESGATADQTDEEIQDIVGAMLSGNTESGITVTYQDSDGTIDFSVASQTDNNFTNADHTKLDGIEAGATADQTNSEIKTAYEANSDTNAFTDADHTKLDGIEASANNYSISSDLLDEDNMSSNSATKVPSQQSVKAYVDAEVAGVVDSAPGALNTLNELAAALGDDENFATTTTNNLAAKLPKAGGQMTGNITFSGSQTVDGRDLSVDGAKLDGIEAGATGDQTNAEIRAAVEAASDSNVFTDADHTKLNGIEASATADQTASEIKTAYESNSNTNAFTDADHSKLDGIAAGAEVNVAANLSVVTGTGAVTVASDTGTNATIGQATSSAAGVMSTTHHDKLDGIETGADVTDATNVNAAGAVMNSDLDGKGELLVGDGSGDPTALAVGNDGYVLKADSSTATGLAWSAAGSGGDVNQNAFSNVAVSGQTTVAADSTTDTLTLAAGSNVTITTNASNDTVTIASTDTNTTYSVGDGGLTQKNFTTTLKNKLDGITSGATNVGGSNGVDFNDSVKARFGTGNDLQIYHDGSNSYLQHDGGGSLLVTANGSGEDIYIRANDDIFIQPSSSEDGIKVIGNGGVELYYDGSKKFESTSSGVKATGNIELTENVYLSDSKKLLLGNAQDLQIYHDGNHSRIDDSGTGSLLLQTNGSSIQLNKGTSENMLVAYPDGAVELYYNGSRKLHTRSDAVNIIGDLDMTDADNYKINLGASSDLKIYHNGSHSYIEESGTGTLRIQSSQMNVLKADGSETMATFVADAEVALFYNDAKKFETTTNGTDLRGTLHRCEGHFRPYNNNTWDLGTSSDRWRNIYTNDLNLSNQGSSNDVDGTWGDWTIQEGENDLFLKNNRSGKKYKFNLTEVS